MTDTLEITAKDRSLHLAFVHGCEWAAALKPGDIFRGSYGEAKHRGLDEDHARYFSTGGQVELTGKRIVLTCHDSDIIHSID